MKTTWIIVALLTTVLLLPLGGTCAAAGVDAVLQWAPVVYQQDRHDNPVALENVFTTVNFDEDWRTNNNSANLPFYPPVMAVYYSVVESDDHYFLGYYFYYPRHLGSDQHENDLAGILLAVRKTADGTDRPDLLVAFSHNQWHKWEGSQIALTGGRPNVVLSAGSHEITVLETSGHTSLSEALFPLPDLISAQSPGRLNPKRAYSGYRLVDFDDLWSRRKDIGKGHTFSRWGYFDGFYYLNVPAPWIWEYRGNNWLAQPAELVQALQGAPPRPVHYLDNPYLAAKHPEN